MKYLDNSIASVEIVEPTFYMNMVRGDPTIDKYSCRTSELGLHHSNSNKSQIFQRCVLHVYTSIWVGRENFKRTNTYSSLAGRIQTVFAVGEKCLISEQKYLVLTLTRTLFWDKNSRPSVTMGLLLRAGSTL